MKKWLGAVVALSLITPAAAQQAPMPPLVRIIVPFSPGASTDVLARAVAAQLGPRLGTTVIVENRPGASGFIGASAVAKGPHDGSQLLFSSVSLVTAAATSKNVPFDVVKDLVPVALLNEGPLMIVVRSTSDIKTPADLIAAAKAKPDTITHGTGGVGTIAHMAAELLNDAAGIQLRHIPYKGAALAVTDMAGGNIDAMIAVNTTFAAQVNAGRARQVAVTSLQPSPAFPGVPTIASVVPGYEVNIFTAMWVPAGTPAAIVARLNKEINAIGQSKELRDIAASDGGVPVALTPEQAQARIRASYDMWKKLATAKNIVAE